MVQVVGSDDEVRAERARAAVNAAVAAGGLADVDQRLSSER